ncbi:hypothetical protein KVR01_007262 [Diaporthe batatas]|uniref:uncharacterized protein n=1 Tax=Diaporthe batatas TaxID=748121 RepID=UPI001D038D0C|nr:uncharacterized protein KVR01_007262 [Diaporthe batatas]KAG8162784.1 hypothetical protein KVR01_007262 [Diaporthe batatas]
MASAEEVARYYPLPTDEYLQTELQRLQNDFQAFQDLIASTRGSQGRDCDCLGQDDNISQPEDDEPCPIHGNRIQSAQSGERLSNAGLHSALDMLTRRANYMLTLRACDCVEGAGTAAEPPAAAPTNPTTTTTANPPAEQGSDVLMRSSSLSSLASSPSDPFGSNDDDNGGDGGDGDATQLPTPPQSGGPTANPPAEQGSDVLMRSSSLSSLGSSLSDPFGSNDNDGGEGGPATQLPPVDEEPFDYSSYDIDPWTPPPPGGGGGGGGGGGRGNTDSPLTPVAESSPLTPIYGNESPDDPFIDKA